MPTRFIRPSSSYEHSIEPSPFHWLSDQAKISIRLITVVSVGGGGTFGNSRSKTGRDGKYRHRPMVKGRQELIRKTGAG